MHNRSTINTDTNHTTDNKMFDEIILLAKPIYDFYPEFDSQSFLTLISVIYKQHNADAIVQWLETECIRPNVYRLNTFTDVIALLTTEKQSHPSKKDILSLFINTAKEIHTLLQQVKEKPSTYSNLQYELNTDKNQKYYQNIISIITNNILEYTTMHKPQNTDNTGQQLTFDSATDGNLYSLSPTQGLAFLNRNPYHFFVEKILGLRPLNDWEENVNIRLYGIIIHEIMHSFAIICQKKQYQDINTALFLDIAMQKLLDYKLEKDIVLQAKLYALSNIAVDIERNAKRSSLEVLCETQLSHIFNKVKITAKADRIEINHNTKEIYIYDYKTGQLPEQKQELNGEKTQLAIIAILLSQHKQYVDYNITKMQYICLSGREKDLKLSKISPIIIQEVKNNLLMLIDYFFINGKPKYDKFVEIKPSSFVFDKTELAVKYLSRISNF